MEGSMAEAMATPNRPRGSCMKRNANCNQLTGPSTPVRGSTIEEAKLVLTTTFTCTAAEPMMAGPIREMMWRRPEWDQSKRGRNPKTEPAQAGELPKEL